MMKINFDYTFTSFWNLLEEFWWVLILIGIAIAVFTALIVSGSASEWFRTPINSMTIVDILLVLLFWELIIKD